MATEGLERIVAVFLTVLAILSIPILLFIFAVMVIFELYALFEAGSAAKIIGLTILNALLLFVTVKVIRWVRS